MNPPAPFADESTQQAFAKAEAARDGIESIISLVRSGELSLEQALAQADANPLQARCFAVKVFEAVPGVGKVRARRTMEQVGIDEDLWLSEVSAEQRLAMISAYADEANDTSEPSRVDPVQAAHSAADAGGEAGPGDTGAAGDTGAEGTGDTGDAGVEPVTFVLSGPGGVGKGTVVVRLLETVKDLWLSRSWTTRDRRPGEAPDAYNFVDRAAFQAHIDNNGFLEWVDFLDYRQGTPVPDPPKGNDVLLEIDVQGAVQIRAMNPNAVLLFLDAPSVEEQEARLRARGDSDERVAQRLETAIAERAAAEELGCIVVINDELERTVAELTAIIEQHRGKR